MANIDNVQLPDGSTYNIVDNTSGFATQNYVDSAVSSVTKTTIGLGNVDNTSDLNKPISTATQTALDTLDEDKADKTDIATVESGTTASRAYSVGELVYVSGTLYRVKTAIASGATFTVGTNVEVTNVSNALKDKGSVSVTADGVKTRAQILNEIASQIDFSKVTTDSKLRIDNSVYSCMNINVSASAVIFTVFAIISTNISHIQVSININNSYFRSVDISNPFNWTYVDGSNVVPTIGSTFTFTY